jgi:hypothetical protein
MKTKVLLLGTGILAATMAFAQDTASGAASGSQEQSPETTTRSTTSQNNVIHGCLSGSTGNYTVTDRNGMQYEVTGDESTLAASVGREVEIRLAQNESTDTSSQGSSTTQTTHSIQASEVTVLSNKCHVVAGPSNPPADNGTSPSNPPRASQPQTPQLMAMLQQQETAKPETSTRQPKQMTPPVTSQTPAAPNSPTNSQVGNSPANNTGMTPSEADHEAQAAPSTNPQTGETSGRGVDNQGVNNPSTTSPNAAPTSPNSTTPSNTPPAKM